MLNGSRYDRRRDNIPSITDSSDIDPGVLGEVYDDTSDEPETIDDWKARDVENSLVAWANLWLNGGPLEAFDQFVLC